MGFEGLATLLVSVNMFSKLVLQPLTIRDVSALYLLLEYWTDHVAIVCEIYVPI